MRSPLGIPLSFLILAGIASPALAQEPSPGIGSVGLQSGVYRRTMEDDYDNKRTVSTVLLQLDGEYRPVPQLALTAGGGFGYLSIKPHSRDHGDSLTNPYVGARYLGERQINETAQLTYFAGLELTFPVVKGPGDAADLDDDELPSIVVTSALAETQGLKNLWRYVWHWFTTSAPFGVALDADTYRLSLDGTLALSTYTGDEVEIDDHEFMYQLQAEGALKFGVGHGGLRYRMGHVVSSPVPTRRHVVEPFLAIHTGDFGTAEASFSMNLNGETATFKDNGAYSANLGYRLYF